jgi:hypothetical protein
LRLSGYSTKSDRERFRKWAKSLPRVEGEEHLLRGGWLALVHHAKVKPR